LSDVTPEAVDAIAATPGCPETLRGSGRGCGMPTERQIAMMRHAIGDDSRYWHRAEPGWRNHYVTSMSGPDVAEWEALAAAGLARESTRTARIAGPTQRCFHVTDEGMAVCAR